MPDRGMTFSRTTYRRMCKMRVRAPRKCRLCVTRRDVKRGNVVVPYLQTIYFDMCKITTECFIHEQIGKISIG